MYFFPFILAELAHLCNTARMTRTEVVQHWKKGAWDCLEVARLCLEAKKKELSDFAVDARYSDPSSAEQATEITAQHWISITLHIVSSLLHD